MWKRFVVRKNERGLLLRDGDFVRVLEPGVFVMFDPMCTRLPNRCSSTR
jgi:regulator of protease activity HflC (stomatin/prohibitin superfamily)